MSQRPVAAVFGAGTMGSGIAVALARAGHSVTLVDRDEQSLERARSIVASSLALLADEAVISREDARLAEDRIHYGMDGQSAVEGARLIIECIIEDAEAKRALYADLDQWAGEDAIIASNTSYLDIFELVPPRRRGNTVIAHWFAPAHIIPLVEVVRGPHTTDEAIDATVTWLKAADRVPIVMEKFIDGFCVNRIQRILGREIFFLLDNGYITPEMLDIAVKASIIPRSMVLGFVQRYDFTGLDLSYGNLQNPDYVEPPLDNQPRALAERVARGDLGVKSGRGFFDYSSEPLVEVLRRRDKRLLKVFAQTRDLIYERV